MKRKLLKVLSIVGIVFGAGLAAFLVLVIVIACCAPKLDQVSAEPDGYLTTVLDDEGEVMLTLAGSEANRIYVGLDQIPQNLQDAVVAIEDSRFYKHHGIDIRGIVRAAFRGITKGHFSEGASTITQQLLKNNVFTDWMEEDSFWDSLWRKLQEQYLAVVLELKESKSWILENYLNTINLGGGTWGVEAASLHYFGKDVSELTLSECSVLAGITKSPTAYNPITNPEESRSRQLLVLDAMLNQGYITQEEYDEASADPVFERIALQHTDGSTEIFSYFEDELIESVLEDLMAAGYSEEDAWNLIYRGGLTIYSTQDTEIQNIAEGVILQDWYEDEDQQVSLVICDVESGAVKAIVGGKGEKTASLIFDRASQSLRQPGSTIKMIGEYAAAIDSGSITLGTAVDDAPYTYSDGTDIHNASGTYSGTTTVRKAIASSLNTVAVKIFDQVGINTVWTYLNKFGIDTLSDADKVEALALGGTSGGVTNLELTAAYNAIANDGTYTKPYFYTKVLDRNGKVLLEKDIETKQVVKAETARLLTSAMEEVIASGTGTAAAFDGMAIAGKSGTTNQLRDVWFVGYSPYYTCGVWGGYDDNRAQTSGTWVKKLWQSVMSQVHSGYAYQDFKGLDSLAAAKICSKCGKLAVDGLCDSTLQGDMTYTEYFTAQTLPTEECDCHVSVTLCSVSGMAAGEYCPKDCQKTSVYLKTASQGTEDEAYVLPVSVGESCTSHTSVWDLWFGGDDTTDDANDNWWSNPGGAYGNDDTYGNDDIYGRGDPSHQGDTYGKPGDGSDSPDDSTGSDEHDGDFWDSFSDWWSGRF